MRRKIFGFCLSILLLSELLFPKIFYKISGKVIYNGKGISGCLVKLDKAEGGFYKTNLTDETGNFHFYVMDGTYKLVFDEFQDLVSGEPIKLIMVKGKNVKNIIFLMEKGCFVSGHIKFEDNTPIKDTTVAIYNIRSSHHSKTDANGYYNVGPIRAYEETFVKIYPTGAYIIEPDSELTLSEGMIVQDYNFTISKKLSLMGKVIDKVSGKPLKDMVVDMVGQNGKLISSLKTANNGEIKFYNFPGGKYWLRIIDYTKKYYIKGQVVQIFPEKVNDIVIELEKRD